MTPISDNAVNPSPTIIKEGTSWLAISKPRGMSIHNRKGYDLISWVANAFEGGENYRPLHRLDTGTSGVILFGKTKKASSTLQQAFEARSVSKSYLAIAQPSKEFESEFQIGNRGIWTWSLTKRAEGRKTPRGYGPMRVPAQTEWLVTQHIEQGIVLKLSPITGRKHQLRRHAAIAGIPLLGDGRYGRPLSDVTPSHLALHAATITFPDPDQNATVEISISSQPPHDFFLP